MDALTPQQVLDERARTIMPSVVKVVNALLVSKMGKRGVTLGIDTIVDAITTETGISKETAYADGWLDFEYIFERNGWKVVYDSDCRIYTFTPKEMPK